MTFNNADHPRGHASNRGAFSRKLHLPPEIPSLTSTVGQRTAADVASVGGPAAHETQAPPGELLAQRIQQADADVQERIVDDATDDERDVLAAHTSADIRFLVARSPETGVDTLNILLDDADPDVAAAAEHSLG